MSTIIVEQMQRADKGCLYQRLGELFAPRVSPSDLTELVTFFESPLGRTWIRHQIIMSDEIGAVSEQWVEVVVLPRVMARAGELSRDPRLFNP